MGQKDNIVSEVANTNYKKFKLGQLVMTRPINETLTISEQFSKDVLNSLRKYMLCDWSEMEHEEDRESNREAVASGDSRIFATYSTCKGEIWIITEWDRSATTILFPSDY